MRLVINPYWLHLMLADWATSSFPRSGGLGYPKKCPYLAEKIPTGTRNIELWDTTKTDRAQVALAISELEHKYRLAITRAYKPWTIPGIADEVAAWSVTDRTWARWVHEAARQLEPVLLKYSRTSSLTASC